MTARRTHCSCRSLRIEMRPRPVDRSGPGESVTHRDNRFAPRQPGCTDEENPSSRRRVHRGKCIRSPPRTNRSTCGQLRPRSHSGRLGPRLESARDASIRSLHAVRDRPSPRDVGLPTLQSCRPAQPEPLAVPCDGISLRPSRDGRRRALACPEGLIPHPSTPARDGPQVRPGAIAA